MTKEITITPPSGFEIDKEKSTFDKIIFKEIVPEVKKPTPKERLLQIIEGTVNHFDEKYPQSVFWMKDGLVFFELDFKNNYLWVRDDKVWLVF